MEEIYKQTNETVTLYTAEEFDRVCVERIESRKTVRIVEMVGTSIDIFAGSGGKSILAYRTPEEIEHVFDYVRTLPKYNNDEKFISQLKDEFISKDVFDTCVLKEGDEVEFLYFMGGGR